MFHRVNDRRAPLLRGKRVTGFTNGEDPPDPCGAFLVEDALKRVGGPYEKAPDWQSYAVVDGPLVTGQNPASSTAAARSLLDVRRAPGLAWPTISRHTDEHAKPGL